jgi:hypothetical protein
VAGFFGGLRIKKQVMEILRCRLVYLLDFITGLSSASDLAAEGIATPAFLLGVAGHHEFKSLLSSL